MAAWKGYDHVPTSIDYHRNGRLEMDPDLEGQSRGMAIPACILHVCWLVLLEENIVSNSLIDLQDLRVKALIHKALASKRPPNYHAN